MFAPEGEEKPKPKRAPVRPKAKTAPDAAKTGLFADEPEEKPRASRRGQPSIFGDEGEEKPTSWKKKKSVCDDNQSDVEEEEETPAPSLSLSLGAMQMFEQSRFLNKVTEESKPLKKKRPYDNSKREANTALKKDVRSYKSMALQSGRLVNLKKRTNCQCA